jgi:hypothetical protein
MITLEGMEKGPLAVEAMTVRVQTRKDNRVGSEERLVVTRTAEKEPEFHYRFSNADEQVPLREMVRAGSERHRAEQVLQEGKGKWVWGSTRYDHGWAGTTP